MSRLRRFTIIVTKGKVAYVSYCEELGLASQGRTVAEAKKNIKEAISLYMEEAKDSRVLRSRLPMIGTVSISC
jgi:predicted RNase H-like HicB family nuclease